MGFKLYKPAIKRLDHDFSKASPELGRAFTTLMLAKTSIIHTLARIPFSILFTATAEHFIQPAMADLLDRAGLYNDNPNAEMGYKFAWAAGDKLALAWPAASALIAMIAMMHPATRILIITAVAFGYCAHLWQLSPTEMLGAFRTYIID